MNREQLHIYHQRIEQFHVQQNGYTKQVSLISVFRLVLFLLFAWFIYKSFDARFEGNNMLYALLSVIALIIAVIISGGTKKKIRFTEQMIRINTNEINIDKSLPSFLNNGIHQIQSGSFSEDLNVFGNYSLFHLLNRTGSQSGNTQLGKHLIHPFTDAADILNYQNCIKKLSGAVEFRQTLLAQALLLDEKEAFAQLHSGIAAKDFSGIDSGFWALLSILWPLAGISTVLYCIWNGNYGLVLAAVIIGLLLLTFILKKINLLYFHISKRSYLYTQYAKCFQLIGDEKFENSYLVSKQQEIRNASKAFKDLSGLTGLFDLRLSMLSLVVNGLFLSDLLCARLYLRWNRKYQSQIKKWFDTLGEFELLNSIATFHYNHPGFVFPEPSDEKLIIRATALGHPLMKETVAVTNDVSIGDPSQLLLITGSNMSGKSTFLRTLGLNIILAQTGAPVFAKNFSFHPVRLLTSFHHIDSLEESTSYFYAELKTLQRIVQSLENPVPALVLLDEVMRGTNSKDKHDGTALLIEKLLRYHCLALIATHDTELGVLAETHPGKIQNHCFESELKNDDLVFDFTMRDGVAQTKNATFLMQKMGIV